MANENGKVSFHASQRWHQRVHHVGFERARKEIERAVELSVPIPNRYTQHLMTRWSKKISANCRKHGTRYRFYPGALFVMKGNDRVITVLPADDEDLSSVLVWLMMNEWV